MHFTCRSFIGHNPDNSWSQYWENESDDPGVSARKGHLFCLVNLSSETDTQLPQTGRNILNHISDLYLNYDGSIPASLRHSLFIIGSNPEYQGVSISLILAVVSGDDLYLAISGSGHILLRRGNTLSPLLSGSDGISLLQGKTLNSDRILLASTAFYSSFSLDYLRSLLNYDSVSAVEESILSDLVNLSDQTLTSAVLIDIHFEDTDIPQPEISSPVSSVSAPDISPPVAVSAPSISVSSAPVPQASRRRRLHLIFALVVLLLLSGSIVYSYRRNRAAAAEDRYQSLKSEIVAKIDQSQKLKPLNLEDSLAQAQSARDLIAEIKQLNLHPDEVTSLESQVSDTLASSGSSSDFSPDFFYDTANIAGQMNYTRLHFFNRQLYLLDAQNHHFDRLDIEHKSYTNLSSASDLTAALDFTLDANRTVFLYSDHLSLLSGDKITTAAGIDDLSFADIRLWNGAVYALAPDGIYRFSPSASGFSAAAAWLKEGQSLPQNPVSMAINGSIWVISGDGAVSSFTQGVKDNFSLQVTSQVTSARSLHTAPDFDKLIFVDGDNLLNVYNKTGQSVSKYNFGDLKILDIALDAANNTVFALCSDQKIYKITLE